MRLEASDLDSLRPLLVSIVRTTIEQLAAVDKRIPSDRLGFTEPEAARLLGLPAHSLRDCRLRGEIKASRLGRRIVYERSELLRFLEANRCE